MLIILAGPFKQECLSLGAGSLVLKEEIKVKILFVTRRDSELLLKVQRLDFLGQLLSGLAL